MAQKITFSLAPEIVADATEGLLLGDFNNWLEEEGVKLKKQKDGSLKASLSLEPGTYQYRYLLNDGRWVNDGNAVGYNFVGEFGVENCVITVIEEKAKTPAAKSEPAPAAPVATKKAAVKKEVPAPKAEKAAAPKAKATAPKAAAPKAAAPKPAAKAAPKAAPKKEAAPAKKAAKKTK